MTWVPVQQWVWNPSMTSLLGPIAPERFQKVVAAELGEGGRAGHHPRLWLDIRWAAIEWEISSSASVEQSHAPLKLLLCLSVWVPTIRKVGTRREADEVLGVTCPHHSPLGLTFQVPVLQDPCPSSFLHPHHSTYNPSILVHSTCLYLSPLSSARFLTLSFS